VTGQVTDTGDGWYGASYRLTRAGKFMITLELAGAQVHTNAVHNSAPCLLDKTAGSG
jgi:hypothetical protein